VIACIWQNPQSLTYQRFCERRFSTPWKWRFSISAMLSLEALASNSKKFEEDLHLD
jgi:hypothetical protein